MAYFYGQWKLSGARMLNGNVSCTVPFTAGGQQFKGIVISPTRNVVFVDANGESITPDEEYGNHIIDFGDGAPTTSIDTGFCYAFLNCFSPYSDNANLIGVEPTISLVGNLLTIRACAYADAYKLYVNGIEHMEFLPSEIVDSIDLTAYIADDGLESYNINVTALFEDDVYFNGDPHVFESAMSNTVTFSLTSEPDEPDEPAEATEYLIKTETLTDIANAIREKRGTASKIYAADFADEIRSIEGGREPVTDTIEITENGVYNPPEGVDGYSTVTVNVENGNSNATTVALDFRNYENGSFTETLSNGLVLTHTVVFDGGTPTLVDNIEVRGV